MRVVARRINGRPPEGWERPDSKKLEGIRAALCRLPVLPEQSEFLDGMAHGIYYVGTDERSARIRNKYKPTAWLTTLMCFAGWQLLTGRPPTRIQKRVEGRMGLQECGEFAAFLAEVFDILGIKARAAGQIRTMQQEMRGSPDFIGPLKIPPDLMGP